MNKTQIGNQNRNRTKKHFEALGYQVAIIEQAKFWQFGGRRFVKKQDTFGADLLIMDTKQIIFCQCKTNKPMITASKREFAKWKWPASVRKVVAVWRKVKNRWKLEVVEI